MNVIYNIVMKCRVVSDGELKGFRINILNSGMGLVDCISSQTEKCLSCFLQWIHLTKFTSLENKVDCGFYSKKLVIPHLDTPGTNTCFRMLFHEEMTLQRITIT